MQQNETEYFNSTKTGCNLTSFEFPIHGAFFLISVSPVGEISYGRLF